MNIKLLQPCTDAYLWNFEHTTAPCSVFTAHGHLTTIDFNDRWSLLALMMLVMMFAPGAVERSPSISKVWQFHAIVRRVEMTKRT